jgi:hypothetical protein
MPEVFPSPPLAISADCQYFRMIRLADQERVEAQFPEPACDSDEFFGVELLVPEENYFPVQQGLSNERDSSVAQRTGQVDIAELGTDRWCERGALNATCGKLVDLIHRDLLCNSRS